MIVHGPHHTFAPYVRTIVIFHDLESHDLDTNSPIASIAWSHQIMTHGTILNLNLSINGKAAPTLEEVAQWVNFVSLYYA